MDDTCPLCTDDEFVVNTKRITIRCNFCNHRFHTSCVRVEEAALDFLSDNVLWFCDKCLVPIMDHRDAIVNVSKVENHLLQVRNLNEKVEILSRLVKAQQRLNDLQKDWIRSLRNVTRGSSESSEQTTMVVVTREPETEPMLGDASYHESVCFPNSQQNSCREQAYRNLTSTIRASPLEFSSPETCLNLLTTAISLQDITLVRRCIDYLKISINAENVLHVYGFLHKCQMPATDPNRPFEPSAPPLVEDDNLKGTNWLQTLIEELREKCLLIIDEHADNVLKRPELLQLPYKYIYDIVTRDTLKVSSERIVYNVIYNWGVEECNRMTLSRQHLPEVLRQLRYAPRYGLMKRKEFKRKMEEILEEKDWRQIKFYLEEKGKNRRVNELPNKMSKPRLTEAQIDAKDRLTRCEWCIINVLTCWTAIFD